MPIRLEQFSGCNAEQRLWSPSSICRYHLLVSLKVLGEQLTLLFAILWREKGIWPWTKLREDLNVPEYRQTIHRIFMLVVEASSLSSACTPTSPYGDRGIRLRWWIHYQIPVFDGIEDVRSRQTSTSTSTAARMDHAMWLGMKSLARLRCKRAPRSPPHSKVSVLVAESIEWNGSDSLMPSPTVCANTIAWEAAEDIDRRSLSRLSCW
jgi:hypothetical protein